MVDVIVVGAGPAGNNVAYRLASLGHSVTVVDWRRQIGDKLCSGIVGRECVLQYPLDPTIVYRDVSRARAVAPGGLTIDFARRDVQAHVVDRVAYGESFAEKARTAGASYKLGHRVTHVKADADSATVQVSNGAEASTLQARALVLACGFGSKLPTQLGLGRVADFATGVQAEVSAPEGNEMQVYLGRDVAPEFFAWLVPTAPGRALVGLLGRRNGQSHLDSLIRKLQLEGTVNDVVRGPAKWGVPLRPLTKTFGDRLVVVGDAAGQVKPTTGGGIYYAILASEIAAETLHDSLESDDLSALALGHYERRWKALLSKEMDTGYSARRAFESLKDAQIDSLMRTISTNGLHRYLVNSRTVSFDWHSNVIIKVLSNPVFGKALNLVNPLLAAFASPKSAPETIYLHQQADFE